MPDLHIRGTDDRRGTRQQQVIDTLREWAVSGVLNPDAKLSEAELAAALGVSRTPIRHALAVLVEEGVLERAGARGYRVRSYSAADVVAAVELRVLVEGYAARRLAARGLPPNVRNDLEDCLAEGDSIFRETLDGAVDEDRYAAMNVRFHDLIVDSADVGLVHEVRTVLDRVPFGGPGAIRFQRIGHADRAQHLQHSHWQHHYIVSAIAAGDGARAEALFREHGELIKVSLGVTKGLFKQAEGRSLPILAAQGVVPRPRRKGRDS